MIDRHIHLSVAMVGLSPAQAPAKLARASPRAPAASALPSAGARDILQHLADIAHHQARSHAGASGSGASLRAVQLDAAHPDLRPRHLDRSARRDLAATLKRCAFACSGLDLFLPPAHFVDPKESDRAVAATLAAIELAADLAALGVCDRPSLTVPLGPASAARHAALDAIDSAAQRVGVRIADISWPPSHLPSSQAGAERTSRPSIGVALDPAAALAAGQAPDQLAATLGERLVSARVSDIARGVGALRCAPLSASRRHDGSLDLAAYLAVLNVINYPGLAVLDLRGVPDPWQSVRDAAEQWE